MDEVTQPLKFFTGHWFVSRAVVVLSFILSCWCSLEFFETYNILRLTLILILLATTAIAWKMTRMNINKGRPFVSSLQQFISVYALDFIGMIMTRRIRKQTLNVKTTQYDLLNSILKHNANTEFGKEFKFEEMKSRNDYVQTVPLRFIAEQEKYINKIRDGEKNILVADPLTSLGVTSGTSGKSSLIPTTRKIVSNFFLYGIAPLYHAMVQSYPQCKQLQRNLKLMFSPRWRFTDFGLRIGPTSSNPKDLKRVLHMYTTPIAAYDILGEREMTYIHLLFALMDESVGMVETNFISSVSGALVVLHEEWDNLVTDVENGTINADLNIAENVRIELEKQMKPDRKRAQALRKAYDQPRRGLLKRIWPKIHLILSADTGAFEVYRRILLANEAYGLRTYSPIYAATEGIVGVNIWPLDDRRNYLLLPGSMFFEFIPIEKTSEKCPETLFMDQVEIGKTYELVITTLAGLYRHRIGDVVQVTRKENECPVVEYLYRIGTLLNVRGEKMSEDYFYKCLSKVMDDAELSLIDYCCVESPVYEAAFDLARTSPPRYHVFFEAKSRSNSYNMEMTRLKSMANELDRRLSTDNYVYSSFCAKGSIGEPVLHNVKEGGFRNLRSHLLSVTEAGANQLKIPRVLRREDAIRLLCSLSNDPQ